MVTKKTSKKRSAPAPTETVVYERYNLTVYKNWDGIYSFEIPKVLCTTDLLEAVSYLMKQPHFIDAPFWTYQLNPTVEVSPLKALYWLSGGDEFWENPVYNVDWVRAFPAYLGAFHERIEAAYVGATLADIRRNIALNLNLDLFFEFALHQGIL